LGAVAVSLGRQNRLCRLGRRDEANAGKLIAVVSTNFRDLHKTTFQHIRVEERR
jgi:hypothetical protein